MKAQSILKFVFGGLFVVALSLLFFQNNQTNVPGLGMDEATGSYASVFQSSTSTGGTDITVSQGTGDKQCTPGNKDKGNKDCKKKDKSPTG